MGRSYYRGGRYRGGLDGEQPPPPGTSNIERHIFELLNFLLGNGKQANQLGWSDLRPDMRFDLPGRGLIVEYDGAHWHRGHEDRDHRKSEEMMARGYEVVRIREQPLRKLLCGDVVVPARAGALTSAIHTATHLAHSSPALAANKPAILNVGRFLAATASPIPAEKVHCRVCRAMLTLFAVDRRSFGARTFTRLCLDMIGDFAEIAPASLTDPRAAAHDRNLLRHWEERLCPDIRGRARHPQRR